MQSFMAVPVDAITQAHGLSHRAHGLARGARTLTLAAHQFHAEPDQGREAGNLKAPLHRCQLARDLDMLGALLKAGSALDAIARETRLTHHGPRCRDVLVHALVPAVSERRVVGREAHGDVHPFGTRHAVPASRARNPVASRDVLTGLWTHLPSKALRLLRPFWRQCSPRTGTSEGSGRFWRAS